MAKSSLKGFGRAGVESKKSSKKKPGLAFKKEMKKAVTSIEKNYTPKARQKKLGGGGGGGGAMTSHRSSTTTSKQQCY